MGEITVSAKDGEIALVLKEKRFKELGLSPGHDYRLVKANEGVWVLLMDEKPRPKQHPLDEKIFKMVREKPLKERVEGKFEELLGKEELERFKELLKEGLVVAFKLSPKYKKAVYKTRDEAEEKPASAKKEAVNDPSRKDAGKEPGKKEPELPNAKESNLEENTLEKDGFMACKSVHIAKVMSEKFKKEIEDGKIRGLKSFDGQFYIAETPVYEKYSGKVISAIKAEKGIGSKKIAQQLGISQVLAKIVCELLKEDGEIIEKRKDQFQAI